MTDDYHELTRAELAYRWRERTVLESVDEAAADSGCEDYATADSAMRWMLRCAWYDLSEERGRAINGKWSIGCDNQVSRIVGLTRLVGPLSWECVSVSLIMDGVYERVHEAMGSPTPMAESDRGPRAGRDAAVDVTENDLLAAVLDMARLFGLPAAHFRPALSRSGRWHTAVQGDGKGYPDLTIAGTEVLFRELKSEVGRLTPEQVEWLRRLDLAGANVGVWRPRDLRSGLIRVELQAIRFADSAKSLAVPQAGVSARSAGAKRGPAWMK